MTPYTRIYLEIRRVLDNLNGIDFYSSRPKEEVRYPFIYLGEQFKQNNRIHKDGLNGSTQVTIHFYHNKLYERGTLAKIMGDVEEALIEVFDFNGENITVQIINENTTGVELLHGILEIEINY